MKKLFCFILSIILLLSLSISPSVAASSSYAEKEGTASIYHTNLVLHY